MSISSALKNVVGSVAPTLATALGGPFAGVAVKFLADKLGVDDTGKVEDFLVSATQDPDKLLELKKAEIEFRERLRELDIKEAELHVRDRESARDLAKERGQTIQAILSAAYTVGYFTTLWAILLGQINIPEAQVGLMNGLLGALGAAQLQILNFWFGSSRGSKDKSDAMARMIGEKDRG